MYKNDIFLPLNSVVFQSVALVVCKGTAGRLFEVIFNNYRFVKKNYLFIFFTFLLSSGHDGKSFYSTFLFISLCLVLIRMHPISRHWREIVINEKSLVEKEREG